MKRISICLGIFFLTIAVSPVRAADLPKDIDEHPSCSFCGMNRKAYGFSRTLAIYKDGSSDGFCSIHCAIVDQNRNPSRRVLTLLVADRNDHRLINADAAIWVMGGSKRGVMTARPKWAFGTRASADAFIREFGGDITPWNEVIDAVRLDSGIVGD